MFKTFRRSWELTKVSWRILQKDKELLAFPLMSMIGVLVVSLVFAIPLMGSGFVQSVAGDGDAGFVSYVIGIVILFLYYLAISIVVTYSNAALTGAVFMRFDGKDPKLSDGFAIANSHLSAIITFAAMNATVGVISTLIRNAGRDSNNLVGRIIAGILASIIDAAWAVVTFLVVPVMVREGKGALDSVKRSGQLLRDTWGSQIVGSGGIGLVFGLLAFLAFLVIGLPLFLLAAATNSGFLLSLAVLVIIVLVAGISLVGGALNSIYRVALYHYAHDQKVEFFEEEVLRSAFTPSAA